MVRPANIFFKVLTGEGRSLEEDCLQFSLPRGVKDGDWYSFQSELGCMLYKNPLPFYKSGLQIYVATFTNQSTHWPRLKVALYLLGTRARAGMHMHPGIDRSPARWL